MDKQLFILFQIQMITPNQSLQSDAPSRRAAELKRYAACLTY